MSKAPVLGAVKIPCQLQSPDSFHAQREFQLNRQPVLIIGSSHHTDRHFFPTELYQAWRDGFNTNTRVCYPVVNALPGRKYDIDLLDNYSTNILPTLSKPTVIIFNLGCNNLDVPDLSVAKAQVLGTIRKLIQMHLSNSHTLVFTSIQPRWSHTPAQFRAAVDLDKRIQILIQAYFEIPNIGGRLGFEPISFCFLSESYLVRRYFALDGTHLSRRGAGILASRLCSIAFHAAEYYLESKNDDFHQQPVPDPFPLPELPLTNILGDDMTSFSNEPHNPPNQENEVQEPEPNSNSEPTQDQQSQNLSTTLNTNTTSSSNN